ncbi:Methionine synthase [Candidatus Methanobinarius endosymbioticus]|uniref:Methionine synthase n=1 Tax=Candidatus Methanobinarius endosymbioticus TaxID=2006182 RepID=A0A366ME49_9EURY|nr:Methionine synthase [Candidatus Methanobinarius endosymbioticus]
MISTVVGSYPVHMEKEESLKDKFLSSIGAKDPYKSAIKYVVESQLKAGIDVISDGQVRGEMVELFTSSTPGFKKEGNTFIIDSKISSGQKSFGSNDLKLAIKFMGDFLKNKSLSKEEKTKNGVKGIITGPCTIVQSSKLGSIYKYKNMAIIDMAYVLKDDAASLEKNGAKLIQIDEPFISTGLIDMKTAKKAINIISDEISIPVSLHSCGDVSKVFKDLLYFNVDIIDCEFAGHSKNLDILEKYSVELKESNKKIGLGVIDTKKSTVDSVEDIAKIIEKGINILGKENLYIDPDCGMKLLPDNVAFSKLNNMVKAMNSFE